MDGVTYFAKSSSQYSVQASYLRSIVQEEGEFSTPYSVLSIRNALLTLNPIGDCMKTHGLYYSTRLIRGFHNLLVLYHSMILFFYYGYLPELPLSLSARY